MVPPKRPPSPEPVAETFESDLARIQEKGKDLKGEQKVFYKSIVDRVRNNVQVLAGQREEHSQLRAKLSQLVKEKELLKQRCDLPGDIKHTNHEVNLLKKQYDLLKRAKFESVESQKELEIVLTNFKQAEITGHPEDVMIADIKNNLDRTNIRNGEAAHLAKMYEQIIYYFRRQTMYFAPIIHEKQNVIAHKTRDIGELYLISRDSKYACMSATYEYRRTKAEVSDSAKIRNGTLEKKKMQVMADKQPIDIDQSKVLDKPQPSLNSTPSMLRNKMTKLAREKREERFRQVAAVYESVQEFFRTTDPTKICRMLEERRETNSTLEKQINDLRSECKELEGKAERVKSEIEEAEYTSAKGVGAARLLTEGRGILVQKYQQKKKAERELEAVANHQKQVSAGCHHLREVLALVEYENEEVPGEPNTVLEWVHNKLIMIKEALENEDQEFVPLVNKETFARQKGREDAAAESDDIPRKTVRTTGFKRTAKDNKLDVTTRVLTRNGVKALALKTMQAHSTQKKGPSKTK
jgi:hypothetical protein